MSTTPTPQLISSQLPSQTGKTLFQSVIRLSPQGQDIPCKVCEKCILIGKEQCIIYDFDLKFSAAEGNMTFDKLEQSVIYSLPRDDHFQWRDVLKDYLNQRGFHKDFKPIKKIGKGNFASVYMAQKVCDQKRYAVKAFSKEAAFSEENGKECLIKEIEIMRHLNSKNNMKLHEVYESENSLYIVFELLEGGQLYDKIKAKHKFTSGQIRTIIRGLLEGLKEMHFQGIMHRDLKPQNILFRKQGDLDCVIADYGLAEFAEEEKYLFVRCGTPGYVAPEVINIKDMKQRYSPLCDIFSLGLIFHVLLKGKSAFKGTSYNEVLSQNRVCDFNLQAPEYAKLEQDAVDLMKKMLQKNPNDRISAHQALTHTYFDEDESNSIQSHQIQQKDECQTEVDPSALGKWDSNGSKTEKDSCLKLQVGKENWVKGKTQSINTVKSTKISFTGHVNRKDKVSKFVRVNGDHS